MIVFTPTQLVNYCWAHSPSNLRETATTFSVLLTQYCSGDQIEKNEVGRGHVTRIGERRGVKRILVGKPEGKTSLRRPSRRWDDNI